MVYTRTSGEARNGHVILVHGLGEHSRRHHRLINRLEKEGFRVHVFDWPGHGRSPGKRGDASIEETLKIIDYMVDNIDEEPFLFGHSLGGLTVLRYAEKNPGKIRGVISSSPALQRSKDMSPIAIKVLSVLSYLLPWVTVSNGIDINDLSRSEKAKQRYRRDSMVHDRISLRLAMDLFHNMDRVHEEKVRLEVPILILAGTADKVTPIGGSERFIAGLDVEDKELKTFQGAFHEIFNDPKWKVEFHDHILRWLDHRS
ncbi:MAG: alpha/beta hydrolase [Candidatus Saliniplasma sp.]